MSTGVHRSTQRSGLRIARRSQRVEDVGERAVGADVVVGKDEAEEPKEEVVEEGAGSDRVASASSRSCSRRRSS